MKYEDVDDLLLSYFPEFTIDEIDEGLPYCVAGSFAHYLLEKYKSNSTDILALAGDFIENLYSYKDGKIDELATVGYLEAIQNVWGGDHTAIEEIVKYLGTTSQKWWKKLNDFWNGDMTALIDSDIIK